MIIEEAFCLANNVKYSASEFKEFISNKKGKNREEYSKFLVCPCCQLAKCKYVFDRKHPHFIISDDAKHRDGCFYLLSEYTQAELSRNIKRGNVAFIERGISCLVDNYLGNKADFNVSEIKRLPQTLITQRLKRTETSEFRVYYGNVKVIAEDAGSGKMLKFLGNNNEAYCELSLSENVFRFLPEDVRAKVLCPDKKNFVCFFGSFNQFGLSSSRDNIEKCFVAPLLRSTFLKII